MSRRQRRERQSRQERQLKQAEFTERQRNRSVKPKFMEEREGNINLIPLRPITELQKEYYRLLIEKDVVIATGLAGTGKTYFPTVMACDEYRMNNIDSIFITRPAISNSKSLGYFAGDVVSKMSNWLGPVTSIMKERLGQGAFEIGIKNESIQFVPFEVIKGWSFKNCYVILDEAEDITAEEAQKFLTRIGNNCKAVLAGDVSQSELKERSGLRKIIDMLKRHPELEKSTGWVDFDRISDIVRSGVCKDWTLAFMREGA